MLTSCGEIRQGNLPESACTPLGSWTMRGTGADAPTIGHTPKGSQINEPGGRGRRRSWHSMSVIEELAEAVGRGDVLVVSGAGMSTDSGLPDYRGRGSTPKAPIDFDMFVSDPVWYRWLWYRNEATWRMLDALKPTLGHFALAALDQEGLLLGVATQNIDRLDARAGVVSLWELHGRYDTVVCLQCGRAMMREALSVRLRELNPWIEEVTDLNKVEITPEADREAAEACEFQAARCEHCVGPLKPGIVMFGESLPQEVFTRALRAARSAKLVIVAGTSLAVSTGMWVVQEAIQSGAMLAVINKGPTQADRFADLRIEDGTSKTLKELASRCL